MKTLIWSASEKLLDGFKFGAEFRSPGAVYTQSVEPAKDYWLLIEDDTDGDSQTYRLTQEDGLIHTDTGVEV